MKKLFLMLVVASLAITGCKDKSGLSRYEGEWKTKSVGEMSTISANGEVVRKEDINEESKATIKTMGEDKLVIDMRVDDDDPVLILDVNGNQLSKDTVVNSKEGGRTDIVQNMKFRGTLEKSSIVLNWEVEATATETSTETSTKTVVGNMKGLFKITFTRP